MRFPVILQGNQDFIIFVHVLQFKQKSFLGVTWMGAGGQLPPAPPSPLEEKVPRGAPPLPEQPKAEPESKQLGNVCS